MKELGAAAELDRAQLEADLLAGLGREPSAIDRVGAEAIAAGVVRSRRLRAAGKSDLEERRTVIQAIRATGMRPGPATPPAQEDFGAAMLRLAMPQQARAEADVPDGDAT